MTNKQLYLLVMAVLMVLPSCSRPVSSEQFVRNASRDAYGRYAGLAVVLRHLPDFCILMYRQAVFKVQFDASGPSLGVS